MRINKFNTKSVSVTALELAEYFRTRANAAADYGEGTIAPIYAYNDNFRVLTDITYPEYAVVGDCDDNHGYGFYNMIDCALIERVHLISCLNTEWIIERVGSDLFTVRCSEGMERILRWFPKAVIEDDQYDFEKLEELPKFKLIRRRTA